MLNKLQPSSVEALGDKLYRVNFDQANPRESAKNRITHLLSFDPEQEKPISRIPHFPFIETEITNEKYSPSMKYRVVFRKKEDKRILEIWSATNLRLSLRVSDYHEDLYSEAAVTQSEIIWSADETRLLYVAEKKADKKVTAFDEIKENETDKYMSSAKFKQDVGEKFNKKYQPEMFVYKLDENQLYKVTNLPEKTFPAYIRFADPSGSSIVFSAYDKQDEFFMGLSACYNHPASVYHLKELIMDKVKEAPKAEKPTPEEEKAAKEKKEQLIKENQAIKLTDDWLALMPIVSPDWSKVAYLSSSQKYIHAFVLGLKKFSLSKHEEKSQVTETVESANDKFNGIAGYHDVHKNMNWLSDSKHIVFATQFRGSISIYIINSDTNELRKLSEKATPGEDWNLLKVHKDRVIASVSSLSGRNRLAIFSGFNLKGESIEQVVSSGKWSYYDLMESNTKSLKAENVISIEQRGTFHEEVLTAEGAEGFFWSVKDFKDSKGNLIPDSEKPLIVFLHGGPHGATTGAYNHLFYYWLWKGYNVLAPNFSGSTGYGQKFIENLIGKNGKQDVAETMALLNLVLERKLANPKKLCVTGGSYGGYLSHALLNAYPDTFKTAIIRNPAVNWLHFMYSSDIPEWVHAEVLNSDYRTSPDLGDLIKIWEISPSSVIKKEITTKILLQLGGSDKRVPYEGALDYYRRLKKNGVDIECHYYPDEGHSLASKIESEFDNTLKRMLFLEANLPGYD